MKDLYIHEHKCSDDTMTKCPGKASVGLIHRGRSAQDWFYIIIMISGTALIPLEPMLSLGSKSETCGATFMDNLQVR